MVNKKVVAICSIIAIIVVAVIVAIQIKIFKTQEYEDDLELVNNAENYDEDEQDEQEEEDDENTTNEIATTIQNQTQEQNSINAGQYETDYHGEEETSSSDATADGENAEEQALSLVKEDWGEDDSVYYTVDNQSGNIYNISVRSKSTTASLAEYEVDMSTETIVLK